MAVSPGPQERRKVNMKKLFIISMAAALLLAGIFSAGGGAGELTGRQIMDRVEVQNDSNDEISTIIMTLINRQGKKRVRKLSNWSKKIDDRNDKRFSRFVSPSDVKGTSVLTIERSDRDDDQWLYLPALRKVRRISSSDKTDHFMGSDFTFEDIQSEDLEHFRYQIVDEETLDGQECWVIEAVPVTEKKLKETGYDKRQIWVRKDNFVIIQTKYWNRKGEYFKLLRAYDVVKLDEGIWRPSRIDMEDFKAKHKTILEFKDRKLNTGVSDDVFTERNLKTRR
jgi:outer membrane lipoprotein-sorting protein